jgi:hypothetical protein
LIQYLAVEAILISTLVKRLIIDDVFIPLSIAAERRDGLHVSPKAVKERVWSLLHYSCRFSRLLPPSVST